MPSTLEKSSADAQHPLLRIRDLAVRFGTEGGAVDAVQGVNLDVHAGETVALVGESGSGKSVAALSVLGLLPYPRAEHPSGSILFEGRELLGAPEPTLRQVRGNRIAMVFQEPMTSLNPLHNVVRQVSESLTLHRRMDRITARAEALRLLRRVGIRNAEKRLDAFPHQMSGGERQRVMIAMALANRPGFLIADEPTTALDVTVQAEILSLIAQLRDEIHMGVLLITHDLTIVSSVSDRVAVMRRGSIVEQGPTREIFEAPRHEYTRLLLASRPGTRPPRTSRASRPVLEARELKVHFPIRRGILRRTVGHVKAVDGIDLDLRAGETLGVVGESGSGKTTLGQALLRLLPSQGSIRFREQDIDPLGWRQLRPLRRDMQFVFQDPYGSLSPRMSVYQIVAEGLLLHGAEKQAARDATRAVLKEVGLSGDILDRYPHEFSGGQRQRISIARALALKPDLLVLDEPTSSLDLPVQAQIAKLLVELQERHQIAYVFISHDLRIIRALADHIIVMRSGAIVERGAAEEIFTSPREAYTKDLLRAAFTMETGDLPS